MIIVGTGSAAMAIADGVRYQAGGWGFHIGDQMSGAILGRELVRRTVEATDGLVSGSPLTAAVLAKFGGSIDAIFMCPHGPDDGCACRKPGTLLLEQAHADWGFDPATTWFVVDATRDVEAALAFGCRPALVRTGKGAAAVAEYPDLPVYDDLAAFADTITRA